MANLFFRNTASQFWNATTNWSTTSGGASAGVIPTASDNVFFDANSGACTQNLNGAVAASIDFTGYTNTFTWTAATAGLTVSGNVKFSAGMTLAWTNGTLTINAASTITCNGKTLLNLTLTNGANVTPADALVVTNLVQSATTSCAWSGSLGFTATNLSITGVGATTHTYAAGITYNIGSFTNNASAGGAHALVNSGTPGTKAILNISGLVNVGYTDFTDINASGRPIYTFNGTVTTSTNVFSFNDYPNPLESSQF